MSPARKKTEPFLSFAARRSYWLAGLASIVLTPTLFNTALQAVFAAFQRINTLELRVGALETSTTSHFQELAADSAVRRSQRDRQDDEQNARIRALEHPVH